MMFDSRLTFGRVLQPEEVRLLQRVMQRLKSKGCIPRSLAQQRELASYILRTYQRGLIFEDQLVRFGGAAARRRFVLPVHTDPGPEALSLYRVMLVEDEYHVAQELKKALGKAGAQVLGPYPDQEAALTALEHEVPDAAVVDLNLGQGVDFRIS